MDLIWLQVLICIDTHHTFPVCQIPLWWQMAQRRLEKIMTGEGERSFGAKNGHKAILFGKILL